MVVLNYTGGEINAKIVYYGPGLSGKTTNLEYIHEKTPTNAKGKMVSMKTQTDRTLFFDFLPLELGEINGYRTRFLLYTVPGQVYYNATRKLVLKGVDAVVFVADSSRAKLDENLESLRNLEQNLNEHGLSLDTLPWIIQYNKRDASDAMAIRDLDARLNPLRVQTFEAIATRGAGVYETFRGIASAVYRVLKDRLERGELGDTPDAPLNSAPPAAPQPAVAAPRARPAPPPAERMAPDRAEPEHEVDSAVDMMLREFDAAPAPRGADPRTAAPPRRPGAVPPAGGKGPRAGSPPTPPPVPTAPRPEPVAEEAPRRASRAPEAAPPAGRSPAVDLPRAPGAGESHAADDRLFESIPDSPFDLELGRLPELEEASRASDSARDEGPHEFVTDPMRRSSLADTQVGKRVETRERPERSERPARLAPAPPRPAPRPAPRGVTVPVVIRRSELGESGEIRLALEIQLIDD